MEQFANKSYKISEKNVLSGEFLSGRFLARGFLSREFLSRVYVRVAFVLGFFCPDTIFDDPHINVATYVPRKQSKNPQFFHKKVYLFKKY